MKNLLQIVVILSALFVSSCAPKAIEETTEKWDIVKLYLDDDPKNEVIGCKIVGFVGEEFNGVMPTSVDGLNVLMIEPARVGRPLFVKSDTTLKILDLTHTKYLTHIKGTAFSRLKYLKEVRLNNQLEILENGVFADAKNLETVVFGKNIKIIGEGAFYNNDGLKSIVLPDNLTEIGEVAFYGCSNLEYVQFGKSLTVLGEKAFGNCIVLNSVEFPNSLTSIGKKSFFNCKKIENIHFPQSLKTIDDKAFYMCDNLSKISIDGDDDSVINISATSFLKTPFTNAKPSEVVVSDITIYQNAAHWKSLNTEWVEK